MGKFRFFTNHAKSSAMFISIMVHGILIAIAVVFVVATAIPKTEAPFVPKKVTRPKMPPKPINVPVDTKKRKPQPRLRQRILSERKTITNIHVPAISGIKGGLGNMDGTGNWNLGFDVKVDAFGSNKSTGNELEGTFYDLKQTRKGEPVKMDIGHFFEALASFVKGWNTGRLDGYYKSPVLKYASMFMIPTIPSSAAAEAFGVSDTVKPNFWAAYYQGMITAPESGRYRFWGYGDDVLAVRINRKLVLDAGFEPYRPQLHTGWNSTDKNNRKFPINGQLLNIGDWFSLNQGQQVKMEVLIGDVGGLCSAQLLIEKEGEVYRKVPYNDGTRPVLPIFKLKAPPADMVGKMKVKPNEATVEGPTFGNISD